MIEATGGFDAVLSGDGAPSGSADAPPTPLGELEWTAPRPRGSAAPLGWTALGLAIVAAPVGLILAIVAAVVSARRTGYASGLAKAALAMSIVLSLAWAGGAVVGGAALRQRAAEDARVRASAAMCRQLDSRPGGLQDAALGWPAVGVSIPQYEADVSGYAAWWSTVERLAPRAVEPQARAIAAAAAASSRRMASARVVDHDRDVADITAIAAGSTLPAWSARYCR